MKKLLNKFFLISGFVHAGDDMSQDIVAPYDTISISLMEIDKPTGIHVYCISGYVFVSQGKGLPMTQVQQYMGKDNGINLPLNVISASLPMRCRVYLELQLAHKALLKMETIDID